MDDRMRVAIRSLHGPDVEIIEMEGPAPHHRGAPRRPLRTPFIQRLLDVGLVSLGLAGASAAMIGGLFITGVGLFALWVLFGGH